MDRQLADNKQNEFIKLWSGVYPMVSSYTASLIGDHHQTEEVMSRIAITVVKKYDQYDSLRSFDAWVMGIARFEILKFRRERARDRHFFTQDLLETLGDRFSAVYRQQVAEEQALNTTILKECLRKLKGRSAKAMAMTYGENLRSEAIGRHLQMTATAVRTMLRRARNTVRECMEKKRKEARPS